MFCIEFYLKIFGKDKVTYVRNITDIDDKIIESSKNKKISIDRTYIKILQKVFMMIVNI